MGFDWRLNLKKVFCCLKVKELKVLIVGLDNAGKTTLLYKLVTAEDVHTVPTIGYNVEEVRWKNGEIKFLMWDLGGQDVLRQSWDTYFSDAAAVILVVDSTNEESLPAVKVELDAIVKNADLASAAILVFANKKDLPNCMTPQEICSKLEMTSINTHKWNLIPSSALTGDGLLDGLAWISSIATRKKS